MISMIAAKSANNVIGRDNDLPWSGLLPADMSFFVSKTKGKPVIMGRNTFDSIGKALPKRVNVVITRNKSWSAENVLVAHSLDEALKMVADYEEVMIIGGSEIYSQCINVADKLYITEIDTHIDDGDSFFPEIDSTWREESKSTYQPDEKNHFSYSFVTYVK